MRKYLLGIFFVISICFNGFAQETIVLTEDDKNQVKARIIEKLNDFQNYLGEMADKQNPMSVRNAFRKSNTLLFIGECEPYKVTDIQSGEIQQKDAVKMETSSLSHNTKHSQLMKDYFNNIMNNRAYSNIKIEQSKAVRIDNIRKVAEGKYEGVAHIHQYFTGYGGDGKQILYSDSTEKAVKIYIGYEEVLSSEGVQRIFNIKLGDMKVVLTEKKK